MSSFTYNGVLIEIPEKQPVFTHSLPLRIASLGKHESNKNIPYFEKLMYYRETDIPEGDLLHSVCALYSIKNLSYQVNNGGFVQYFNNGYHRYIAGYDIGDLAHIDIFQQVDFFKELINFIKISKVNPKYEDALYEAYLVLKALAENAKNKDFNEISFYEYLNLDAEDEIWYKACVAIEWGLEVYAQYLVKRLEELNIEQSNKQTGIL